MPAAHFQWTVLRHGPVDRLADNIWCVEGSLPDMPIKRTFTLVRLQDRRLVLHNPCALDEAAMEEIEAWGKPAFLLVPNGWHRLDARAFKDRYPDAVVLCPKGSRKRVEQVVPVDGSYADFPSDPDVALEHLDGVANVEGVMRVRSRDGTTLAFCDAVFNQPHLPGAFGFVYRVIGMTGGPRVPLLMRTFLVKDRKALRAHLERLAAIQDLRRVITMHGRRMNDPAELRAAAATL